MMDKFPTIKRMLESELTDPDEARFYALFTIHCLLHSPLSHDSTLGDLLPAQIRHDLRTCYLGLTPEEVLLEPVDDDAVHAALERLVTSTYVDYRSGVDILEYARETNLETLAQMTAAIASMIILQTVKVSNPTVPTFAAAVAIAIANASHFTKDYVMLSQEKAAALMSAYKF